MLIGVDAGASGTSIALAEHPSTPLARALGEPAAITPGRESESAKAIGKLLETARAKTTWEPASAVLVVGAAGAEDIACRNALAEELEKLGLVRKLDVTTDAEVALESAFPTGAGILVYAGTGSFACTRLTDGTIERVGGLGWRIGDEGGGYQLAVAALREVGRALQGRAESTGLRESVANHIGHSDRPSFVRWANNAERDEIATLAKLVCDEARRGDPVAVQLVRNAAQDLLELARALIPVVTSEGTVPVALAGGLLSDGSPVRDHVLSLLDNSLPGAGFCNCRVDGALGALQLAHRLARQV